MRLYEFQAKRIFAEHGIPAPKSRLLTSSEDLSSVILPAVLKAQVPVGGRGRAGGIRIATDLTQAAAALGELLGADIRGHSVQAILAEELTEILREIYLALMLDKGTNQTMVIASAVGGIDIEQVARQSPDKIVKRHLPPFLGLPQFIVRYVANAIGFHDVEAFGRILQKMYELLCAYDATLVEINPLAETRNGLVALDAKVVLDDKAAHRHIDRFESLRAEQARLDGMDRARAEQMAVERGLTYVLLDGEVGLISDGAGTGMLTLDLIQDAGGRAANFCELGGLASPDLMCQAIEVVLANPKVKVLLISLIGGLTRMDEMADGVVQYLERHGTTVPIVVRMYGTQEEAGKATLAKLGLSAFDHLPDAVQQAVALAGAR
jgi:succinyl-CoA synthetase beta subunit